MWSTEQELPTVGNDDHETPQLPMPLASLSFSNSLSGAISYHQQFGCQLSHHEPPHGKHSVIKECMPEYDIFYLEHWRWQCELLKEQTKAKDKKIQELEEQVRNLLGGRRAAALNDIYWFTEEQKKEVEIILDDTSVTWTDALGKILVIAFGKELLSRSCAVGKKNATNIPLNPDKLDAIKSVCMKNNAK